MENDIKLLPDQPLMVRLNEGYPAVWSNGEKTFTVPEKPRDSEVRVFGNADSILNATLADARFHPFIGFVQLGGIETYPCDSYCSGSIGGILKKRCDLTLHPALVQIRRDIGRTQKEFYDMLVSVAGLGEEPRIVDMIPLLFAMKALKTTGGAEREDVIGEFEITESIKGSAKLQAIGGAALPKQIVYHGPLYLNSPIDIRLMLRIEWKDKLFWLKEFDFDEVVLAARRKLVGYLNREFHEHHEPNNEADEANPFYLG